MLRKAGFVDLIGRANLVAHFDDALARARVILGEGVPGKPLVG